VPARLPAGHSAEDWRDITAEPRRYGFHGTLKAPFRMAAGHDVEKLKAALEDFAKRFSPVLVPLEIARLGRFVAFIPVLTSEPLDRLAGEVVASFDPFRRPLDEAERIKRLNAGLTPRQTALLDRWGYPYVFDEFRYHMTLTGPLHADRVVPVQRALQDLAERELRDWTMRLQDLALFAQSGSDVRFRIIGRFPLGN
jgi:hypothetical protein